MSVTLICYGDSNTYGFDPRSFLGERYPKTSRWTGIVEAKTGWNVLNYGLNGRCIPHTNSQIDFVCEQIVNWAKLGSEVCLWIMLGTNDLLMNESFQAEQAASRMEVFLSKVIRTSPVVNKKVKITLIAPPAMQHGAAVYEERLVVESKRMGDCFCQLAKTLQVSFIDMSQIQVPLLFDGVHLSEEGHRKVAAELIRQTSYREI